MRKPLRFIAIFPCLWIAGCSARPSISSTESAEIESLRARVAMLEAQVRVLQEEKLQAALGRPIDFRRFEISFPKWLEPTVLPKPASTGVLIDERPMPSK